MLIFFGIEIDYIYNVINFVTKSAILAEFSLKCGGTYIWSISVPIRTLAKS